MRKRHSEDRGGGGGEDMKRKRMDFDGGRGFARGPEGQDDIETPPATLRILVRQSVSLSAGEIA